MTWHNGGIGAFDDWDDEPFDSDPGLDDGPWLTPGDTVVHRGDCHPAPRSAQRVLGLTDDTTLTPCPVGFPDGLNR